jgi:hypothetical protein
MLYVLKDTLIYVCINVAEYFLLKEGRRYLLTVVQELYDLAPVTFRSSLTKLYFYKRVFQNFPKVIFTQNQDEIKTLLYSCL